MEEMRQKNRINSTQMNMSGVTQDEQRTASGLVSKGMDWKEDISWADA